MSLYNVTIRTVWFVFMVVWLVLGISAKKNVRRDTEKRGFFVPLLIMGFVMVMMRIPGVRYLSDAYISAQGTFVKPLGAMLCAAGIGFAIWARVYLGKNWGMPQALKEKPELVVSGPYRFVRHPIYVGLCVAMAGSAFVEGPRWLIWLILLGGYFLYSAKEEEKLMLHQFPDQYPAYRDQTIL